MKPRPMHRVVARLAVPLHIKGLLIVPVVALELMLRNLHLTPLTPSGLLHLSRRDGLLQFALGRMARPEGQDLPWTGRE